MDFWTEMALEGRVYQVKAGTITASLTGDEAITSTASEMCVDAAAGVTFLPFEVQITWDGYGGDALECAGKSVGTASSGTAAYVPIPLYSGGISARCTALVAASAAAATVAAEATTTTRQHFHYSEEFVRDDTNQPEPWNPVIWHPKLPPVCKGVACFYVQVASATTGPKYFGHILFAELLTVNVT